MDTESLDKLKSFPQRLEDTLAQFSAEQLNIPDKDGEGWTPAQLVHHICDAHTQAYYRIKWMITEPYSVIKPFDQDKWANLSKLDHFKSSLNMIRGVSDRWVSMMENLEAAQWDMKGWHPENGLVTVEGLFTYYINHGEGHLQRLKSALNSD